MAEYKLPYTAKEIEDKLGQVDEKLDASALNSAINTTLAEAKASGEFNGEDGISATHSWNDTTLTITSASGTSSADLKGEDGKSGVYLGSGEMPEDCNVQIDPTGEPIEVYTKTEVDALINSAIGQALEGDY